jgi:hypothetical protein
MNGNQQLRIRIYAPTPDRAQRRAAIILIGRYVRWYDIVKEISYQMADVRRQNGAGPQRLIGPGGILLSMEGDAIASDRVSVVIGHGLATPVRAEP